MKGKKYTSFKEIEQDLKRLDLERQIAFEKLKGEKHHISEEISNYSWVNWFFKLVRKYGVMMLLRKIIK